MPLELCTVPDIGSVKQGVPAFEEPCEESRTGLMSVLANTAAVIQPSGKAVWSNASWENLSVLSQKPGVAKHLGFRINGTG